MGQPDIARKGLIGHPDVFADIMNAFIFEGRQVLSGENLRTIPTEGQQMREDTQLSQVFRDVCMEHVKSGVQFLILGIENQMAIDHTMPLRCMGYDYETYQRQITDITARDRKKGIYAGINRLLKNQRIHPVITIVLYYGEEEWIRPLDIRDMMLIPEGEEYEFILPYIQNYKMNLIHVNQLTEAEMECLHSDFKYIAKLMNKRYNKEKLIESMRREYRRIVYLRDTMFTIQALTKNRKIIGEITDGMAKGGRSGMGNVLDYLIEKTEAETEEKMATLTKRLLEAKKYDELKRMTSDKKYRDSLYEQYHI